VPSASERAWEHFEHGADVGVRGWGDDAAQAFARAGAALAALVAAEPERVRPEIERSFEIEAPDLESLFVAFLNELIFRLAVERLVLAHFEPRLERPAQGGWKLRVRARGERFDPDRHDATVEPKGATFTGLAVQPRAGRWVAECVVDV
jgi:SHS2 domain-containing protein